MIHTNTVPFLSDHAGKGHKTGSNRLVCRSYPIENIRIYEITNIRNEFFEDQAAQPLARSINKKFTLNY